MSENEYIALIERFVAAWQQPDIDALAGYFTDDAVYHNMPMRPVQGRDAIRAAFAGILTPGTEASWEMVNIAAHGNVVLTERVDRFVLNGRPVAIPVMGAFELRDGKISAWRDYFDLQTWQKQARGE